MNIKDLITENFKKPGFLKTTSIIIEKPELITELLKLIKEEPDYPYPEYSSWLLLNVFKKAPNLAKLYTNSIIDIMITSENKAVLRNMTASSVYTPLDDYRESELLDRLIFFLKDSNSKASLIVNSIYKLIQFTHKYIDIKYEILNIIDIIEQKNNAPSIKVAIREYRKCYKYL